MSVTPFKMSDRVKSEADNYQTTCQVKPFYVVKYDKPPVPTSNPPMITDQYPHNRTNVAASNPHDRTGQQPLAQINEDAEGTERTNQISNDQHSIKKVLPEGKTGTKSAGQIAVTKTTSQIVDIKSASQIADTKTEGQRADTKPASQMEGAKTTCQIANTKSASQITGTKTEGQITDTKLAGLIANTKSASQITGTKTEGQITDTKPAGQIANTKSASQITGTKTEGQITDTKLAGQIANTKSASQITGTKTEGQRADTKPASQMEGTKTTCRIANTKSASQITGTKTEGHITDTKLAGLIANTKSASQITGTKTEGQIADTKPAGQIEGTKTTCWIANTKSASQITGTKTEGHIADKNPDGQIACTKTEGHTVGTKPAGRIADTKSASQIILIKTKGQITDTKTAGQIRELMLQKDDNQAERQKVQIEVGRMQETVKETENEKNEKNNYIKDLGGNLKEDEEFEACKETKYIVQLKRNIQPVEVEMKFLKMSNSTHPEGGETSNNRNRINEEKEDIVEDEEENEEVEEEEKVVDNIQDTEENLATSNQLDMFTTKDQMHVENRNNEEKEDTVEDEEENEEVVEEEKVVDNIQDTEENLATSNQLDMFTTKRQMHVENRINEEKEDIVEDEEENEEVEEEEKVVDNIQDTEENLATSNQLDMFTTKDQMHVENRNNEEKEDTVEDEEENEEVVEEEKVVDNIQDTEENLATSNQLDMFTTKRQMHVENRINEEKEDIVEDEEENEEVEEEEKVVDNIQDTEENLATSNQLDMFTTKDQMHVENRNNEEKEDTVEDEEENEEVVEEEKVVDNIQDTEENLATSNQLDMFTTKRQMHVENRINEEKEDIVEDEEENEEVEEEEKVVDNIQDTEENLATSNQLDMFTTKDQMHVENRNNEEKEDTVEDEEENEEVVEEEKVVDNIQDTEENLATSNQLDMFTTKRQMHVENRINEEKEDIVEDEEENEEVEEEEKVVDNIQDTEENLATSNQLDMFTTKDQMHVENRNNEEKEDTVEDEEENEEVVEEEKVVDNIQDTEENLATSNQLDMFTTKRQMHVENRINEEKEDIVEDEEENEEVEEEEKVVDNIQDTEENLATSNQLDMFTTKDQMHVENRNNEEKEDTVEDEEENEEVVEEEKVVDNIQDTEENLATSNQLDMFTTKRQMHVENRINEEKEDIVEDEEENEEVEEEEKVVDNIQDTEENLATSNQLDMFTTKDQMHVENRNNEEKEDTVEDEEENEEVVEEEKVVDNIQDTEENLATSNQLDMFTTKRQMHVENRNNKEKDNTIGDKENEEEEEQEVADNCQENDENMAFSEELVEVSTFRERREQLVAKAMSSNTLKDILPASREREQLVAKATSSNTLKNILPASRERMEQAMSSDTFKNLINILPDEMRRKFINRSKSIHPEDSLTMLRLQCEILLRLQCEIKTLPGKTGEESLKVIHQAEVDLDNQDEYLNKSSAHMLKNVSAGERSKQESTLVELYRNVMQNETLRMMTCIDMVVSEAKRLFGNERTQIFFDLLDDGFFYFGLSGAAPGFIPNMTQSTVKQHVISFFEHSCDTMNRLMTLLLGFPDSKILQQMPEQHFISLMRSVIDSSLKAKTKGGKILSLKESTCIMVDSDEFERALGKDIPEDVLDRLKRGEEMVVHRFVDRRLEKTQASARRENRPIHSIYFPSDCRLFIYIPTENGSYWHQADMKRERVLYTNKINNCPNDSSR